MSYEAQGYDPNAPTWLTSHINRYGNVSLRLEQGLSSRISETENVGTKLHDQDITSTPVAVDVANGFHVNLR